MDLIKTTSKWALGNVFQGKIMMTFGILTLFGIFFILKTVAPILKGMLMLVGLIPFFFIESSLITTSKYLESKGFINH